MSPAEAVPLGLQEFDESIPSRAGPLHPLVQRGGRSKFASVFPNHGLNCIHAFVVVKWKLRFFRRFQQRTAAACYQMRGFVAKTSDNAAQRLLRRISERLDEDRDRPLTHRRTQRALAKALDIKESSLSELLRSATKRGLLVHLDKIAQYFGVPPTLLIHANDTALMELTPEEYRVISHWRTFPPDVQEQVAAAFDYFAGLLPEEKSQRRIWHRWRALSTNDQARLDRALEDAYRATLATKRATRGHAVAPEKPDDTAEPSGKVRRRAALP